MSSNTTAREVAERIGREVPNAEMRRGRALGSLVVSGAFISRVEAIVRERDEQRDAEWREKWYEREADHRKATEELYAELTALRARHAAVCEAAKAMLDATATLSADSDEDEDDEVNSAWYGLRAALTAAKPTSEPSAAELAKIAKDNPPPQSWYDEDHERLMVARPPMPSHPSGREPVWKVPEPTDLDAYYCFGQWIGSSPDGSFMESHRNGDLDENNWHRWCIPADAKPTPEPDAGWKPVLTVGGLEADIHTPHAKPEPEAVPEWAVKAAAEIDGPTRRVRSPHSIDVSKHEWMGRIIASHAPPQVDVGEVVEVLTMAKTLFARGARMALNVEDDPKLSQQDTDMATAIHARIDAILTKLGGAK